jgi:hypothetical protein
MLICASELLQNFCAEPNDSKASKPLPELARCTAIAAHGINLGLTKMAEACPSTSFAKLFWLSNTFGGLREAAANWGIGWESHCGSLGNLFAG